MPIPNKKIYAVAKDSPHKKIYIEFALSDADDSRVQTIVSATLNLTNLLSIGHRLTLRPVSQSIIFSNPVTKVQFSRSIKTGHKNYHHAKH